MTRATSTETVRPRWVDWRGHGEMVARMLCPEAADPFAETTTLLGLEDELSRHLEDADGRHRAISDMIDAAAVSAPAW